jgi:hypothetical protein
MIPELGGWWYSGEQDVLQQVLAGSRAFGILLRVAGGFQDAGPDFPSFLFDGRDHFCL